MGLGIPPLKIKILLESNPLKSRIWKHYTTTTTTTNNNNDNTTTTTNNNNTCPFTHVCLCVRLRPCERRLSAPLYVRVDVHVCVCDCAYFCVPANVGSVS